MKGQLICRIVWALAATQAMAFNVMASELAAKTNLASYPDFADFEDEFPLDKNAKKNLTLDKIRSFSGRELALLYARLTAGPIPEGMYKSHILRNSKPESDPEKRFRLFAAELSLKPTSKKGPTAGAGSWFTQLADNFWVSKRFFKGKNRTIVKSQMPQGLKYPGEVSCGQSLLDARRESIIIDYQNVSDPHEREKKSSMLGRNGLRVRDELRMVKPGSYLGRAYLDRRFFLNYLLTKSGQVNFLESCQS